MSKNRRKLERIKPSLSIYFVQTDIKSYTYQLNGALSDQQQSALYISAEQSKIAAIKASIT